jgi:hypothetical protein
MKATVAPAICVAMSNNDEELAAKAQQEKSF